MLPPTHSYTFSCSISYLESFTPYIVDTEVYVLGLLRGLYDTVFEQIPCGKHTGLL